jgi:flagellar protein FliS
MMVALSANKYYQTNQISTAGRGSLLIMVYDGAIRFLIEGKNAMNNKRIEEQNRNLTKAQTLITELMTTLDHSINPELARNLEKLYMYMLDKLVDANVYDKVENIDEVIILLKDLRDAWSEADQMTRRQETNAATIGGRG